MKKPLKSKNKRFGLVILTLIGCIGLALGIVLWHKHAAPPLADNSANALSPSNSTLTVINSPGANQTIELAPTGFDVNQLYELTNKGRIDNGLQPLKRNSALDASAQAKCQDMATNHYYDHISPTGVTSKELIKKYVTTKARGENLAVNSYTAEVVNTGFMNSPGHRTNILRSNFTDVGFAYCKADGTIVTEDIGYSGAIWSYTVEHFAQL